MPRIVHELFSHHLVIFQLDQGKYLSLIHICFLAKHGVSCIIAGGMGQRAQDLFTEQNIETIIGVTGSVEQVIADYLAGSLQPGESLCDHRHGGHHCSEEQ